MTWGLKQLKWYGTSCYETDSNCDDRKLAAVLLKRVAMNHLPFDQSMMWVQVATMLDPTVLMWKQVSKIWEPATMMWEPISLMSLVEASCHYVVNGLRWCERALQWYGNQLLWCGNELLWDENSRHSSGTRYHSLGTNSLGSGNRCFDTGTSSFDTRAKWLWRGISCNDVETTCYGWGTGGYRYGNQRTRLWWEKRDICPPLAWPR